MNHVNEKQKKAITMCLREDLVETYIYIYIYISKNTITINNNLLSYSRMDKHEVNKMYSAARNQFLRFLSSPTNLKRYLFDKLIL